MQGLRTIRSNSLCGFRTTHQFQHYGAFHSVEEYISLVNEAQDKRLPIYILGKGSNTYFVSRNVQTAVLKNELPETIEVVKETAESVTVHTSSSTSLMKVLRFCEQRGLDSFYFLASVPGNIGGGLAMNAGGPAESKTIFEFVDYVAVCEEGKVRQISKSEISITHRLTPFTGQHARLIVSAQFTFLRKQYPESPIRKRIEWYKAFQDTSGPSLGSVFKSGNGYVFGALKRLKFGFFGSHWSSKWPDWIVCERGSLFGIRVCIWAAKLLHSAIGKRAELEIIEVK